MWLPHICLLCHWELSSFLVALPRPPAGTKPIPQAVCLQPTWSMVGKQPVSGHSIHRNSFPALSKCKVTWGSTPSACGLRLLGQGQAHRQSPGQMGQLSPPPWHWQWGSQRDKGLFPLCSLSHAGFCGQHTQVPSGSQEWPCCRGRVKLTKKCWTQPPASFGGCVCYKSTFLLTSLKCFDCSKHQKPVRFNEGQVVSWICKSGLLFSKTYFKALNTLVLQLIAALEKALPFLYSLLSKCLLCFHILIVN